MSIYIFLGYFLLILVILGAFIANFAFLCKGLKNRKLDTTVISLFGSFCAIYSLVNLIILLRK